MKILSTRAIPSIGLKLFADAGHTLTQHTERRELTQSELIAACKEHDALLSAGPNKLDAFFLQECRHLKAITLLSVGYDNVDMAEAAKLKMPIGNTPGVLSGATADTAFLLMLAVSRKAFYLSNTIAKGDWGFYGPMDNLGIELNGKTLGIFGLGRIGIELARKCAAAYHMKIIYHNRNRNEAAEKELSAKYVSFDELLQQSDVLSAHANLSPETKGIFNIEAFSKMKPSCIFINTARGAMHNEQHLTEALQQKNIWGAGLDVTNPEPMEKNNILLSMPNVCIMPHVGSGTVETRDAMTEIAAKNIIAGLNGQQMEHAINPEVYQ